MEKVLVTGLGIISSIGLSIDEHLLNLRSGKHGLSHAKNVKSKYADTFYFGEIKNTDADLKEILNIASAQSLSRTCLLALYAFKNAIHDAAWSEKEWQAKDTAFISSSTVGGMSNTDALYVDANAKLKPSPYVHSYHGAEHAQYIFDKYQMQGYFDVINTACSSSANAILLATQLIQLGKIKRAIVGGADALAKFTINGFNALQILSKEPCKPFDKNRNGLNLGEGAAYLILEAKSEVKNKKTYTCITGYGNANDAYHLSSTSPSATGPIWAMQKALEAANLKPEAIDYINAHGTGTENNDSTELFALNHIFGEKPKPFNATKSFTGHTLAAAGAMEAIFTILSIKNQELFPSLRIDNALKLGDWRAISTRKENYQINHALSNSFGFNGNGTSFIFSKCI